MPPQGELAVLSNDIFWRCWQLELHQPQSSFNIGAGSGPLRAIPNVPRPPFFRWHPESPNDGTSFNVDAPGLIDHGHEITSASAPKCDAAHMSLQFLRLNPQPIGLRLVLGKFK